MKKIIFQFVLLSLTIVMVSCSSESKPKASSEKKEESKQPEIVYNDSIQKTFFGVSFGANRKEVIQKMREHHLYFDSYNSTETTLRFSSSQGRVFTFGGMSWEMLDIGLSNSRFYYIRFMNAHNDKAAALQSFDNLLSTVSTKYGMNEIPPKDSTEYKKSAGYSKRDPHHEVVVKAYRYESIGKKILNGVSLEYFDTDYKSTVSDEL